MRFVRNEPAGVRAHIVRVGRCRDKLPSYRRIDWIGCSFEKPVKVIPTQHVGCRTSKRIVVWTGKMKLTEESILISHLLQQLRSGRLEWRHLRVRQIVAEDGAVNIRSKRIAAFEEDGTAG